MSETFGKIVRRARLKKGMSGYDLSRHLRRHMSYVCGLETRGLPAGEMDVQRICLLLDIPDIDHMIYKNLHIPQLVKEFIINHHQHIHPILKLIMNHFGKKQIPHYTYEQIYLAVEKIIKDVNTSI